MNFIIKMLSDLKKLNTSRIITPALLIIKPNLVHNIKKMIEISGDKDRSQLLVLLSDKASTFP